MTDYEEEFDTLKREYLNPATEPRKLQYLARMLAEILEDCDDNEWAHYGEDTIYRRVLEAIAGGHPHPRELSDSTHHIANANYEKWYA